MSCEEARAYVIQYLKDEGAEDYVSVDQIDALVKECCDDIDGQPCQEALATVAATVVCSVYTEGACVPCCEKLGEIVGPVLAKGVEVSVEILKSVWGAVSSLFTSDKKYNYGPAYRDLQAEYSRATEGLAIALADAWVQMRLKVLGHGSRMPIVSRKGPGGTFVPVFEDDPDVIDWNALGLRWDQAWLRILMHNAAVHAVHDHPPQGSYEQSEEPFGKLMWTKMLFPEAKGYTPKEFFSFAWSGNMSPDLWLRNADGILNVRYESVEKAMARFASDMMQMTTLQMQRDGIAEKLMNAKLKTMSPALKRKPDEGTSPLLVVGGLAALAGLGYAGYRYRDELFG
jgi:hypothetical protein